MISLEMIEEKTKCGDLEWLKREKKDCRIDYVWQRIILISMEYGHLHIIQWIKDNHFTDLFDNDTFKELLK